MAFSQREPIGAARADFHNAWLMALIANCHRDSKKREPFEPKDFMVDWDAPREEQPEVNAVERVMGMAKMLTEMFNAGKSPAPETPRIILADR